LDALGRRFRFVDGDEFARFLRGGGLPRRPLLVTFDDCYEDLVDDALGLLEERGVPAVAFAVTSNPGGTNDWDAEIGAPELRLADADGLRTLSRNGVLVGSHSRTHAMLNRLEPDALAEELAGSAADLEAAGLARPIFLAYPHGEHDEQVRRATAAAGYEAAFTVEAGLARPGGDPFAIPRIEILRSHSGRRFLWTVLTAGRLRRDRSTKRVFGRRARSDTPSPPA
jgi:peptidoglycan/xylan/chitin deacetylase (PgdA/CDA1 family)